VLRYFSGQRMSKSKATRGESKPIITRETFRFFRDLARNNRTAWMQTNRERYQECIVQPLRHLCEELAPAVLRLDPGFETSGRTGANLCVSIGTFASPRTRLRIARRCTSSLARPFAGEGETGQLYVGISAKTVTAGFRIYCGSKRKESALGQIAASRVQANPRWIAQQKKRLSRRYESYWYRMEKGEWTKQSGWPDTENWKKLQAWIVRRELGAAAATRKPFCKALEKIFRDLYPLVCFTSLRD
jgi:uncharacterized protein (DUF2461 family)